MGVIEPENYWNKISRSSHVWAPSTAKAGCSDAGAMVASPNNGSAYDLHANKQPVECTFTAMQSSISTNIFTTQV